MNFRKLRADEIEVRACRTTEKSIQVLLYKDARCDMNVLDESGEIWQRRHYELKGNIYCEIGIWSDTIKQWVWKGDAGAESNTEAVKGEASDSFKRAGFNWGIGRELYTAPQIYLPQAFINEYNGKKSLQYDTEVTKIEYDGNKIVGLEIMCTGGCWTWGTLKNKTTPKSNVGGTSIENAGLGFTPEQRTDLLNKIEIKAEERGKTQTVLEHCGISKISDMSDEQIQEYKGYYKL